MKITHWGTYDDRTVSMEEMDHQHMSNIHYYIGHILPDHYTDDIRGEILKWLVKRFAGVILPYKPVPDFIFEKRVLRWRGFLQPNNDIVVNGEKIGCYE